VYLSSLSRCASICCDTSGAGVVVLVPGRMSSSIMSSLSFAANTSWKPSHSSPESSKAMIAQSGCLCSSSRSRCCLCSSPRRRCRHSRCCLCFSPRRHCSRCRRGQRCLPRLCRGSAHGETDLTTGELDRRSWQRQCVCSAVLMQTTFRILARLGYSQKAKLCSQCGDISDFCLVLNLPVQNITLNSSLIQSIVI